ncbi:hypothetical protein MNBD_GAMMA23-669 [hydrothermal vent metagenome]|uniref:SPOR domain-containing protein n=1 Tax=hydrothermal vent metagenome TaxID=652676 RepID=A0A3B1ALY3_9ZZZZ
MLKWFLYSLILLNIGFFAWNSRSGVPLDKIGQFDEPDGAVRLLLLKEKQQQLAEDNLLIAETLMCFSVGPFARKAEVRAAQKRLNKWDIQSKRRVHKTLADGFWVIIPPLKSSKAAGLQIKKLKELGVSDYSPVSIGSEKNAISLGIFSKSSSARRRLAEMKKFGVKAKIVSKDLPRRSYWLDWPSTGTALTAEQLARLQKTFKGIGKVSLNCSI